MVYQKGTEDKNKKIKSKLVKFVQKRVKNATILVYYFTFFTMKNTSKKLQKVLKKVLTSKIKDGTIKRVPQNSGIEEK